jgi:uncharacterized membrane protein YcaP (DUF421 family)
MDSIIRPLIVYLMLLALFRLSGKRTMAQTTPFDMVLLLIISETVQEALIDGDHSITNAFVLVVTLVLADVLISFLKQRWKKFDKVIDGTATIIVEDGKPLKDRMDRARIDEADVMEAARELQGLERMEQIKYAVLEKDGTITVIPQPESK